MLTVICSSRFGTQTLPRVLSAYEHLVPPRGGWKLVVVDAHGSGRAIAMLKSYASRLPLEIAPVSSGGLPAAIEAALRTTKGDLLVLTDGNSIPAPNWLTSLRDAADRRPEFDVFAGAILPCWNQPVESEEIAWHEQGVMYALSEPRSDEGPISAELVWASNVGVRTASLRKMLGWAGGARKSDRSQAVDQEPEWIVDGIGMAGHHAWYVPEAAIRLSLSDWQQESPWFIRPALRRGRAMASLELQRRAGRFRSVARFLCSSVRVLCKRQFGFLWAHLTGDLQDVCRARWRRDLALGKLLECHRQWPF